MVSPQPSPELAGRVSQVTGTPVAATCAWIPLLHEMTHGATPAHDERAEVPGPAPLDGA